jgi:hypothetical protein
VRALALAVVLLAPLAQAWPRFEDFPVPRADLLPSTEVKVPAEFTLDGNAWRNAMGKCVAEVRVNFAGQYYLTVNSCGTGCRYYTLHDLKTGRAVKMTTRFDRPETAPPPVVVDLETRADSRLVLAREQSFEGAGCRERAFVFERGQFRSLAGSRACR